MPVGEELWTPFNRILSCLSVFQRSSPSASWLCFHNNSVKTMVSLVSGDAGIRNPSVLNSHEPYCTHLSKSDKRIMLKLFFIFQWLPITYNLALLTIVLLTHRAYDACSRTQDLNTVLVHVVTLDFLFPILMYALLVGRGLVQVVQI